MQHTSFIKTSLIKDTTPKFLEKISRYIMIPSYRNMRQVRLQHLGVSQYQPGKFEGFHLRWLDIKGIEPSYMNYEKYFDRWGCN